MVGTNFNRTLSYLPKQRNALPGKSAMVCDHIASSIFRFNYLFNLGEEQKVLGFLLYRGLNRLKIWKAIAGILRLVSAPLCLQAL